MVLQCILKLRFIRLFEPPCQIQEEKRYLRMNRHLQKPFCQWNLARKSAKLFGVSHVTMDRRLKASLNPTGRPRVFSPEEEASFVDHIRAVASLGSPITYWDIRCIRKQFLDRIKRRIDRFKNNFPGKKSWYIFKEACEVLNRNSQTSV